MARCGHFLIVEDDRAVARTVARALRPRTSTILTSVREAIGALEGSGHAALVIDVRRPEGSGFAVLEHARTRDPFVDALVMSGDARFANSAYDANVTFGWKRVESARSAAFAVRVGERRRTRDIRITAVLDQWTSAYGLTPSERDLLRATALEGASRKRSG